MRANPILCGMICAMCIAIPVAASTQSPLSVSITAQPNPIAPPKSLVVFHFQVTNTGPEDLIVQKMADLQYGDLGWGSSGRPCLIPRTLAPSKSYSCQILIVMKGSPGEQKINTLTVTATQGSSTFTESADVVVFFGSSPPAPPKNQPPEIAAIDPISASEGENVHFIATATDPDGDALTYHWSLEGIPLVDCSSDTFTHAFGDNGEYQLAVTVEDGKGGSSTHTETIVVMNVEPSASIPSVNTPSTEFILPIVHQVSFLGSFTDPGWLDTHTVTWDFGDGSDPVILTPLKTTDLRAGVSETTEAQHAFFSPGDYTVRLAIEDDDGGIGTESIVVHIADVSEAIRDLSEYIQSLDTSTFKGKDDQRMDAFANKFSALETMVASNQWNGAMMSLQNDIRSKADGQIDGNPKNDWIQGTDAQSRICAMIDDIVNYMKTRD